MLYYGTFKNRTNTKDIAVYIQTAGSSEQTVHMGDSNVDDIQFMMDDPVVISSELDNTFDVLIVHECTINLLVRQYLGDSLFTGSARNVIVNVWEGDKCIFAGFVEPNIYNQPWDKEWVSLSLSCTDAVATLQYYNYQNLINEEQYNDYKMHSGSIKLITILSDMLRAIPTLDLRNGLSNIIYYDGSVRLSKTASATSIWDEVQLYELLFLGDELDDVWTLEDAFTEILKYFNLHMRQEGLHIYIYHWQSVRRRQTINWTPLLIGQGNYRVSQDSVIIDDDGNPHEELIPIDDETGTRIPGNKLIEVLGDEVERVGNEWRKYYYWVYPNGDKVKNPLHYEVVDPSGDLIYIHLKDTSTYKILTQSDDGDYVYNDLEGAPAGAYSGGSFNKPYFQPKENEFIISER